LKIVKKNFKMKYSLMVIGVLAYLAVPLNARGLSKNRQSRYLQNIEAVCAGHPNWTLVPNINDCRKFFVCINREYEEMECAEGYHFNRKNERCTPGYCANIGTADKCQQYEVRRIAEDCTAFLSCRKGTFVRNQCPESTYFDATYSSCLQIANNPRHQCSCIMPEYTVLPNADNCETYYTCTDGKPKLHQCPSMQYYSENVSSCLPDFQGICIIAPTMPPMEMALDTAICREGRFPYHAHETDCNKFYLCVNGKAHLKHCAIGYYFDETLQICLVDENKMCDKANIDSAIHQELNEVVEVHANHQGEPSHHLNGGVFVIGYHTHNNNSAYKHEQQPEPLYIEEQQDHAKPLYVDQHLLAPVYGYLNHHAQEPAQQLLPAVQPPVYNTEYHSQEHQNVVSPPTVDQYNAEHHFEHQQEHPLEPPTIDQYYAEHHIEHEYVNQHHGQQYNTLIDNEKDHIDTQKQEGHLHKIEQFLANHKQEHSTEQHVESDEKYETHKHVNTGVLAVGYHHSVDEHQQGIQQEHHNNTKQHQTEHQDEHHEQQQHQEVNSFHYKHDGSIEEGEDFDLGEENMHDFAAGHMKNEVLGDPYKPQTYSSYDKLSSKFIKFF